MTTNDARDASPHPYREPHHPPLSRRFAWGAFVSFAWVLLGSFAMMMTSHAKPFAGRFELFAVIAVAMLLGVVLAFYMTVRHGREPVDDRPMGAGLAIAALPIGRHRKGKTLFAPDTTVGAEWITAASTPLDVPEEARVALGAEWRDNGKKEHASVAAFAQLTLDLMAVGAPPELVSGAQRDALDEIRHAAACFALARDIDGREESPAPFPDARTRKFLFTASREIALTQIAIDALADGVLNEGIASRLLAQLAKKCELPAMAPVLREMAADESRHAAHSWEIIAWCLEVGGNTVLAALRGATAGMPTSVCSALPAGARDGAWEKWGVHGVALEAEAFARTREAARAKLGAMLAQESHATRSGAGGRGRALERASKSAPSTQNAKAGASADHASSV
jgi:hypothetical protein